MRHASISCCCYCYSSESSNSTPFGATDGHRLVKPSSSLMTMMTPVRHNRYNFFTDLSFKYVCEQLEPKLYAFCSLTKWKKLSCWVVIMIMVSNFNSITWYWHACMGRVLIYRHQFIILLVFVGVTVRIQVFVPGETSHRQCLWVSIVRWGTPWNDRLPKQKLFGLIWYANQYGGIVGWGNWEWWVVTRFCS